MDTEPSEGQPALVELFVKAGKDGQSMGGCPLCHRVAMILAVKASRDRETGSSSSTPSLTFTVTPVNLARPTPDSFRKSIDRLPAIVHNDTVLTDSDEIIAYLDHSFPVPVMGDCEAGTAAEACRDLFSKFSFFIRQVANSPTALLQELRRIDAYLSTSTHSFIRSDHLDHLDCNLLPKLQHVRIASKALRGFEIPSDLAALWRYLSNAYRRREFRDTCPSDQEIIRHWLDKPECMKALGKDKMALIIDSNVTYTFDVPRDIQGPSVS